MDSSSDPEPAAAQAGRLDSWKEIAAYLNRDVRTVQRWEKQESLPVHRHLHDERGTAYAYREELDEWLRARTRGPNGDASAGAAVVEGIPRIIGPTRASKHASVGVVLGVVGLGAIAVWSAWPSRPDSTPLSTLSITFPASERFREWGPEMALSPDGRTLAYAPAATVYTRRIDELEGRVLVEDAFYPFFSPDGRWVGVKRRGGVFNTVALDGGAPVPLGGSSSFTGATDWGSDNHIVYANVSPDGSHGLYRLPSDGGPPQLVATLAGETDGTYWLTPQSLDNGRTILCTIARTAGPSPRFEIVAVSVTTGERRRLVDDARHGLYIGDGVLIYQRRGVLFATRLDLDRLEVLGPHVPAWEDVHERVRLRSWTYAGGTLVYWPKMRAARRLVWVDRTGKQDVLPLPPALYQAPRVSPDGKSIVYGISESSELGDVWRHDLSTGATVQLTSDGRSGTPLWRPDGTGIVFSSLRTTNRTLFQLPLSGSAEPEPILIATPPLSRASTVPASWTDGGRTLIVSQTGLDSGPRMWAVALDGSRQPRPVSAMRGGISPDGRWLVYDGGGAIVNGPSEVFVAPFPAGRPQWQVSTGGGAFGIWSRSGRELFYHSSKGVMMVASVTPGPPFRIDTPRPLFESRHFEAEPGGPNYDISADDQRFLMVLPGSSEGPDRLNVVLGWKNEVLRRLREHR